MTWRESYALHNKDNPLLTLTRFSMMKTMTAIGKGQGPLQARLSLMRKNVTRGANAEAHLQGAWDTTPWAGRWISSLSHLSHAALKGLCSLGDSSSWPSPFITAIQTLWSMWASLTKGWQSTLKTKCWCAMFSRLAWNQRRRSGSTA